MSSESLVDLVTTVFGANLAITVVFTGGYIASGLPASAVSRLGSGRRGGRALTVPVSRSYREKGPSPFLALHDSCRLVVPHCCSPRSDRLVTIALTPPVH